MTTGRVAVEAVLSNGTTDDIDHGTIGINTVGDATANKAVQHQSAFKAFPTAPEKIIVSTMASFA